MAAVESAHTLGLVESGKYERTAGTIVTGKTSSCYGNQSGFSDRC